MLAEHLIPKLAELIANPKDKYAIAFSGGGDSTALVHALKSHPQHGPVFIVDHALRVGSNDDCLLYTSPSPRDATLSRMPSSA